MTKVEMKNTAMGILGEHKAPKALTAALTELFEQYASNSKMDTVKRPKHIKVDGVDYTWCNRHEVYELSTNHKNPRDCVVANKHWSYLGKAVTKLNDELFAAAMAGEDTKELALQLKEAKELRAGRYNLEANELQYADIEGYTYGATTYAEVPEDAEIIEEA